MKVVDVHAHIFPDELAEAYMLNYSEHSGFQARCGPTLDALYASYEGVEIREEKALIEKNACRACNLCVLKCPQGAIRLENYGRLEALIEKYKKAEAGRSFRAFMGKERIGLADKLALPARLRIWGLA